MSATMEGVVVAVTSMSAACSQTPRHSSRKRPTRFVVQSSPQLARVCFAVRRAPASLWRQHHRGRMQEVAAQRDDDQVRQQDEGPAHVVADDIAFLAYELAGGDTDAGGLRRHRL